MSSYLTELATELERRGNAPVDTGDLIRALYAIAQAFEAIEKHRDTLTDTVQTVNDNKAFIEALEARLMIVDTLPEDAPFGALIRRRNGTVGQRATLYTGNGPGEPLARLVPQAL